MLIEPLKTRIITQEKIVFDALADSVVAPAVSGYLGILPGHAPLMAAMGDGVLKIKKGKNAVYYAVFGGFLQVKDNQLIILADKASAADELSLTAVREELSRAEAALDTEVTEKNKRKALTREISAARIKIKVANLAAGVQD